MNLLFDASSILRLSYREEIEAYIDHATTPLAQYEIGNTVWKKVNLTHEITEEEGETLISRINETLEFMTWIKIEDPREVLAIASREKLSYYDASYLQAAITMKATLVSEDAKLRKAAAKYIATIDCQNIHQ